MIDSFALFSSVNYFYLSFFILIFIITIYNKFNIFSLYVWLMLFYSYPLIFNIAFYGSDYGLTKYSFSDNIYFIYYFIITVTLFFMFFYNKLIKYQLRVNIKLVKRLNLIVFTVVLILFIALVISGEISSATSLTNKSSWLKNTSRLLIFWEIGMVMGTIFSIIAKQKKYLLLYIMFLLIDTAIGFRTSIAIFLAFVFWYKVNGVKPIIYKKYLLILFFGLLVLMSFKSIVVTAVSFSTLSFQLFFDRIILSLLASESTIMLVIFDGIMKNTSQAFHPERLMDYFNIVISIFIPFNPFDIQNFSLYYHQQFFSNISYGLRASSLSDFIYATNIPIALFMFILYLYLLLYLMLFMSRTKRSTIQLFLIIVAVPVFFIFFRTSFPEYISVLKRYLYLYVFIYMIYFLLPWKKK